MRLDIMTSIFILATIVQIIGVWGIIWGISIHFKKKDQEHLKKIHTDIIDKFTIIEGILLVRQYDSMKGCDCSDDGEKTCDK
jgi:hypothetical protein